MRASTSPGSCRREMTRVPRLMMLKYALAARRTDTSPSLALEATRAKFTMRRGLIPCAQAEMHLPLLVQTAAQRSASGGPGQQVQHAVRDRGRIRCIKAGGLHHRTGLDAFAAPRA